MTYYNENDSRAAAWLRALIEQGSITAGDVDERSITDVTANDLLGYTRLHFFAGIGGWDLALQLAQWPDDMPVWTGSCPCQPFSNAGKGGGTNDERHLWPQFYRLIEECRPSVVFGEQVASPLGRSWLDGVFADLEANNYSCGALDLCAAGLGAPHIRQRLYWVADTDSGRREQRNESNGFFEFFAENSAVGWMGDSEFAGLERHGRNEHNGDEPRRLPSEPSGPITTSGGNSLDFWYDWRFVECADGKKRRIESTTEPLVDGFPNRVAVLHGLGNAICPPLAAEFIKAYREVEANP